MKTIATLIFILVCQHIALCQAALPVSPQFECACAIGYSEKLEAIVSSDSIPRIKCRDIMITSLPPSTQNLTSFYIEFGRVGSFTFKKDSSLEVPEDSEVFIEDNLTGKIFNLKTSDAYTFNVNRRVPNRFILHVLDKPNLGTAVSSK
jgi:hypothetical protein